MKDLTILDIFPRQEQLPTRLSVILQGHWVFSTVVWSQGVRQSDGATYFYMQQEFGIIAQEEYQLRFPYAYTGNPNGSPMTSNTGASTGSTTY